MDKSFSRSSRLPVVFLFTLGLILAVGLFTAVGRAAPANPVPNPPPNSPAAPLTTTLSITYDEPISPTTVTSRTFVAHAMQSGRVEGTYAVVSGTIVLTPTHPFHQGELVSAIATSGLRGLDGAPAVATQWQFNTGRTDPRCVSRFVSMNVGLQNIGLSSAAWGDYDRDGDLDILFTGWRGGDTIVSQVYRNNGGYFTIAADLPGVYISAAAWGDYDNDGDLDIVLAGYNLTTRVARIYRNDGGVFVDINAPLIGVDEPAVDWGDYDNDGDLDLLLAGAAMTEPDIARVYRNDDGFFVDIGAGLGTCYFGAVDWGDYDNDGDLDILTTGASTVGSKSTIYRNDGGHFVDIAAGLPGLYASAGAWGDYDGDGDLDIVLAGEGGSGNVARVYRNENGAFVNIGAELTPVEVASAAWGDYDNDGDLDLLIMGAGDGGGGVTKLYRNEGGTFVDTHASLSGAYWGSIAWGDYDNDSDLDILLTGYYPLTRLYRNDDCPIRRDLAIAKTVIPPTPPPGGAITYTIAFSNVGNVAATGIIITDAVPVSLTVTGVVSTGALISDTGANPPYRWRVGDLLPGQSGIITITGLVNPALRPSSTFTNTAVITFTEADTHTADNRSSAAATVAYADLFVSKTVVPLVARPGQIVTFTLAFGNAGTDVGTGLVLTDSMPVSISLRSMANSGAVVTQTGPGLTWLVQDLAPGARGMITLTGQVTTVHLLDTLANAAAVTTTMFDPYPANNRSSAVLAVPLLVTGVEPAPNFVGVPPSPIIKASFTEEVSPGSIQAENLAVQGMMSGLVTGTLAYVEPGHTLIVTPSRPFHSAETVRVTLSDRIENVTGLALDPYQWQFTSGPRQARCVDGFSEVHAGLPDLAGSSAAWGDFDRDGDLDLLLTGAAESATASLVYRNDGDRWTDIEANLAPVSMGAAAWGDYDNDGDLDILLTGCTDDTTCSAGISRVYRNDGGVFTDINAGLPDAGLSSVAWGDYDNDGDLDILLAGCTDDTACSAGGSAMSRIYRNDAGIFTDIEAGLIGTPFGSAAWGDYDGDGDLDILLTGGAPDSGPVTLLYRNDAGTFVLEDTDLPTSWGGEAAWGDYDNDGDLDIALAGSVASSELAAIYRNDPSTGSGRTFTYVDAGLAGGDYASLAWGDYDNDGDLDLVLTGDTAGYPSASRVYRNDNGSFVDIQVSLPAAELGAVAWGDYDGDGGLDLVLTGYDGAGPLTRLYHNDPGLADLALAKRVTPQVALPGEAITYTLTFSHTGPACMPVITDVQIIDPVPVSLTVTAVMSSGVAITRTGNGPGVVWQVQDLAPGQGGVITITGVLSPGLPSAPLTNTATITTAGTDDSPANNRSSARLDVYAWQVVSTAPAANATSAPLAGPLTVTFDGDLDPGSAIPTSLAIQGMHSGLASGTYAYDPGGRMLSFTPARPFHAGEIVRASATGGLLDLGGSSLRPMQWQFRAGAVAPRCAGGFSLVSTTLQSAREGWLSWGDYDQDDDLDLLLGGSLASGRNFYRNDGGVLTMANMGLPTIGYGEGLWGDYDNDGDLDVLLTGSGAGWTPSAYITRLYRNDGGSFTLVDSGLPDLGFSSAAWGDYDNDGDLDLLIAGETKTESIITRLYRNDGGSLTDSGVELIGVQRGAVAWGDYDNDGDLDIALDGIYVGFDQWLVTAAMYRNDEVAGQGRRFTRIAGGPPPAAYSSLDPADYDGDGDVDLLFSGCLTNRSCSSGATRIYRNDGGTWTALSAGLTGVYGGSAAWGDYDNDGDLDILLTGTSTGGRVAHVYRNTAGTFADIGAGLTGVGLSASSWGDYDGDGDLDIVLSGVTNSPPTYITRLYRNADCPRPDLAVDKKVTPSAAGPGETVTYRLAFSNLPGLDSLAATGVLITDSLPVNLAVTGIAYGGVPAVQIGEHPHVWSVATLSPGQSGVITLTAVLTHPLAAGTLITNVTAISSGQAERLYSNNHSTTTLTVEEAPPVAVDDVVTTPEDTPLAIGVLENDWEPNGQPLLIAGLGQPVHGSAILGADSRVVYTPTLDYHGGDTFTYVASDGVLTATAIVSLIVQPVNDPPRAGPEAYATDEDVPLSVVAPGVLGNDSDLDGDTLTASLLTAPLSGTLVLAPDGSFVYTPTANYYGDDTFYYQVSDGVLTGTAAVSLTIQPINDPPVLAPIGPRAVDEGVSLAFAASATDPDLPLDMLAFSLAAVAPSGAVIDPASGAFSWTPNESQGPGVYSITLRVTDDGTPALSDAETFTVTVAEVNRPPLLAPIADQTVDEQAMLSFTVAATDPDVPSDTLTFSLDVGAPPGAAIDPGTGQFTWMPDEAQGPGTYTVTVRVTDSGAPPLDDYETIQVIVGEINVAPITASDAYSTTEDAPLVVEAPGVLANDSDPDLPPNALTVFLVTGPGDGELELSADGSLVYTPEPYWNGVVTFTYSVSDGLAMSNLATSVITVTPVNNAPWFTSDPITGATEDMPYTYTVTAADVDAADVLTLTAPLLPAWLALEDHGDGTGTLGGTPANENVGDHVVVLQVRDAAGLTATQSFSITVVNANDAPVLDPIGDQAVDEETLLSFTASAMDADLDDLTFSLDVGAPPGVSIDPVTGLFIWTPSEVQGPGVYGVTVRVTDDGVPPLDDYETIQIVVAEINQAPVLAPINGKSVDEGTLLLFTASATDGDVPPNVLSYSVDMGAPAGASIESSTGLFTWTPSESQGPGVYSVTIRVTDDGTPPLDDWETIQITVYEVNLPPVAAADSYSTPEDTPLVVAAPGVLGNDGDPDLPANPLAAVLYSGPIGSLDLSPDGSFEYTPVPDYDGAITFTYRISDSLAFSDLALVTITVTPVCDYAVQSEPAAAAQSGDIGTTVTYTLRVTNSGECIDILDVAVTALWPTGAPATVGPLAAGEGTDVVVTVAIPTWAGAGDRDVATFTITSQGDSGVSVASALTTTANVPNSRVYLPLILRQVQFGAGTRREMGGAADYPQ